MKPFMLSVRAVLFTAFTFATFVTSVDAQDLGVHLAATAHSCLGNEMWKPGYGLSNGKLGCSAAVCNVLKKAGVKKISTAAVVPMCLQLLKNYPASREFIVRSGEGNEINDARLSKLAKPGDILLGFMAPPPDANSGGNAHCGIMGTGNQVYTNNWLNGIWTEVDIHQMFDFYPYIRLIRIQTVVKQRKAVPEKETDYRAITKPLQFDGKQIFE